MRGLQEAGWPAAPVHAALPRRVAERLRAAGRIYSPAARAWRSASAAIDLARSRPAACIQDGCEYRLATRVPFVTLEDQTMTEARRRAADWPWLRGQSERDLEGFVTAQQATYARARACCFMSHWAAASMLEDHAIPADKVHVVGVGRNHDPAPAPRDWERPAFLFLAVDWRRKNGDLVVRAFEAVRDAAPRAELHLVGRHPRLDGPGVVGHGVLSLRRPEERARAAALLSASTCLVLPSRVEPSASAYAEALAAGIPSVYTTVGGAATIVGDAGIGVDPDDERGLAAAMLALADPDRARQLGARALARAPLFTWRAVAERLLRALSPSELRPDGLAEFL
jgi:glycosyltransferase involved in cell wall biosynthesis